ncbi:hypothetical protein DSM104299_02894 [Baekduia alba]|nr:hypothetical protein DSM104299_02894 [Baekduia alba]
MAVALQAEPAPWRAAGFAVAGDGRCRIGTTDLVLGGGDGGFAGWTVSDAIPARDGLDGVPTTIVPTSSPTPSPRHPNTVSAIDHVVLATPDTARTFETLEAAGFALRRVRDAGPELRQGFFLFDDVLLEVVGPPEPRPGTAGDPARLWGVTLVADDLDAAAAGDHVGAPRDAAQPGRRIAVVDRAAGLGVRVALMSPRA